MAAAVRLNLSDKPITIELLRESLARTGAAIMVVNGTSMHPTLQMGWRVFVAPATGVDLKVGDIAVFRGEHYLTIHRLVWKEEADGRMRLVFRGDYNRVRERIDPDAVIARVTAIEIPSRRRGMETIVALERDALGRFYAAAWLAYRAVRPILPRRLRPGAWAGPAAPPPGSAADRLARAARFLFRTAERAMTVFLPQRR
jgi:signal peptidase I